VGGGLCLLQRLCARREAAELVDLLLEEIAEELLSGEPVKLRGFGAFKVRSCRSPLLIPSH